MYIYIYNTVYVDICPNHLPNICLTSLNTEKRNQEISSAVFPGAWGCLLGLQPDTVDARHPANRLRLAVYPIIYRVLYIPGGAGSLSSTVCWVSQGKDPTAYIFLENAWDFCWGGYTFLVGNHRSDRFFLPSYLVETRGIIFIYLYIYMYLFLDVNIYVYAYYPDFHLWIAILL